MRQDALREFNHYKRLGYCYDLGSLAYDYLNGEGKIPKEAKDRNKAMQYAKESIVKELESDLKIASDKMKPYWQDKIDKIDDICKEAYESKSNSVIKEKIFMYFKRYAVNQYFSML